MNPYGVKVNANNILAPLTSLRILYDSLPKTVGCEKCASVNGPRKDWCCRDLNPSMFYIEFLNVWQHVQNEWNKKLRRDLIFRAVKNYLRNSLQKGCIFYKDGCLIHPRRPLACFTKDTMVLTIEGPKEICKILPGDKVFTHKGRYKRVLATYSKLSNQYMSIRTKGDLPITCTEDHLFWSVSSLDKRSKFFDKIKWVRAKDIVHKRNKENGHYLVFPDVYFGSKLSHICVPDFIECYEIDNRVYPIYYKNAPEYKSVKSLPAKIKVDKEFLWILGLYLAEGSSNKSNCVFSLHVKEQCFASRVISYFEKLGFVVNVSQHRNAMQLSISGSIISQLMLSLCGRFSDCKSLNEKAFSLMNKEQLWMIFEGWHDGDGVSSVDAKSGIRYTTTTTSRKLVYQMYFIAMSNGLHPFLYSAKRPNRSTTAYTLIIYEADYHLKVGQGSCYKVENGFTFYPVKEVNTAPYDRDGNVMQDVKPVFDLQVEDDESFVTSAGVAHNCHMYGVTPAKVWDDRIALLKERHGEDFPVHGQCDQVTTEDGCEEVSYENDDKWFAHVHNCECRLGVTPDVLKQHDLPGGSYRTFHDHLLIELFPPDALEALTKYRFTNPTEDDIEDVVEEIIDRMDEFKTEE